MLTALAQIEETGKSDRNSLPRKTTRNSIGAVWYRADYELRSLRDVKRAKREVWKCIDAGPDAITLCTLIRELDRLIERERVLLRIPLPASAKSVEPRRVVNGSVSYTDLVPGPVSTPSHPDTSLVMSDESVSQPVTSPGPRRS